MNHASHGRAASRTDEGYSLVELLVAALCTLIVLGALVDLVNSNVSASRRQPEAIDIQQRLRAGVATLFADLYGAGAGIDSGVAAGSLARYLPAVIPRRVGLRDGEPRETARPDAVSLLSVPGTHGQSVLLDPILATALTLTAAAGCPPGRPLCGLDVGAKVLVFDRVGRFDLFTVTGLVGVSGVVRHLGGAPSYGYAAGASAAEVDVREYYFDGAAHQLRRYDADASDAPVLDNVTALVVRYFGDAAPPRVPKPPPGESNCLYDVVGAPAPALITLPATDDGLAELPLRMLGDGPWCGGGGIEYDADLLRIRRVRVTMTVAGERGAKAATISFDVAPRNLQGIS